MKPKKYDYIKICLGYPSPFKRERIIWRKWNGVTIGVHNTVLFGKKNVYAINLEKHVYINQHTWPNTTWKKVLTLNLKKEFFEQIRSGEKLMEFREIKPYWTKRLFEIGEI